MADPSAFIARCREVIAKATPGPWEANYGGTMGHIKAVLSPGSHTPTVLLGDGRHVADSVPAPERAANMVIATLAVNALPALLEVAGAAVAKRAAERAYFGSHSIEDDIERRATALADSSDALDAALAALAEVPGE